MQILNDKSIKCLDSKIFITDSDNNEYRVNVNKCNDLYNKYEIYKNNKLLYIREEYNQIYNDKYKTSMPKVEETLKIDLYCHGILKTSSFDYEDWSFKDDNNKLIYRENGISKCDTFVDYFKDLEYIFNNEVFKTSNELVIYDFFNDKIYLKNNGIHEIDYKLSVNDQVKSYLLKQDKKLKSMEDDVKEYIINLIKEKGYKPNNLKINKFINMSDYIDFNSLITNDIINNINEIKKMYNYYVSFIVVGKECMLNEVDKLNAILNNSYDNNKHIRVFKRK